MVMLCAPVSAYYLVYLEYFFFLELRERVSVRRVRKRRAISRNVRLWTGMNEYIVDEIVVIKRADGKWIFSLQIVQLMVINVCLWQFQMCNAIIKPKNERQTLLCRSYYYYIIPHLVFFSHIAYHGDESMKCIFF